MTDSATSSGQTRPRDIPPPMSITEAAAEQVKRIMAERDGMVGLRVGVSTKGCSGLSYTMEYAEEILPHDLVVEDKGVTLLVEAKATMFLIGTEMDYVVDKLESGFRFNNPNETARCGCGESFHVG